MNAAKQSSRLHKGGHINRQKQLNFTFNGSLYQGYEGDTLASALLANDVHLIGRGMKFHRPRGILSAGPEEPNGLVKLGQGGREEPNARATTQPLYEGLVAESQNCWPSVKWDVGALLDFCSSLWPAGFYNKTFIWPNWHWYEHFVRRAAGLGTLPTEDDPDTYSHRYAHCDYLICGGGWAGLEAAHNMAKSGQRVMVVEQSADWGGSLLGSSNQDDITQLQKTLRELHGMANVTLLNSATAVGFFDHNMVSVVEKVCPHHLDHSGPRERLWKIRATEVVLATGAIEQPVVFPNNDRPGIMLASAVVQYLNRYGVACGRNVAIVTNNDSAYQTAFDLHAAGIKIAAIIDSRPQCTSDSSQQAEALGIRVLFNAIPLNTVGRKRIRAVQVADCSTGKALTQLGKKGLIACDCLAMSGGWQPAVHLFSQARGKLRYDEKLAAFVPDQYPDNVRVVGRALAGRYEVKRFIPTFKPAKQWLDFQHDVTLQDIDIAVQEDYVSVEHLKRYTTTGMSVDQGKTSNINALTALAERTGKAIADVGTTTFRPFYMPVTLGTIAGRRRGALYAPTRQTPMHQLLKQAGAEFWDYGHWQRPAAYPQAQETLHAAMQREALAVRNSVGIYDGSPLGKIEVRGPDAAEFLNRLYINNVHSLKPGKARYGMMLDEKGIVIDDGIFVRLNESDFLVHTTSGNAEHILAWMEEWQQCEWPDLNVLIRSVTTQWANATISGPNARKVLEQLDSDIDLSNENFPHMSFREGLFSNSNSDAEDVPVRIMRASFTGEMGYEINVPSSYGAALWQNLMTAGRAFEITPYGVESLMILRSEKGYLHVGADTDGRTIPDDIGWSGPIKNKQADFIGKRSLLLAEQQRQDRFQYVGIEPVNGQQELTMGSHIINSEMHSAPAESQGYVTSAFYSPNLNRWIALGLVKSGRARIGEGINIFHRGKTSPAKIVAPLFFDQEGGRLHV